MRRATMRTFVYVDGFNLYYVRSGERHGSGSTCRPCSRRSSSPVTTSRRSSTSPRGCRARASDPSKPQRQDVYLRALGRYRPEVEVYFGHFLTHRVRAALAQPVGNQRTAEVIRTEEKGSDVNLAVHLLNDGWLDTYDCAVVVSNDSDIAEAMRLVKEHHGKLIGLVTPGARRPSQQLMAHADFARHVRPNALRQSQLPDPIPGSNIRKPARW